MALTKKNLLKIIIIGDSGVGKTSLLNRYVTGRFSTQYKATIGADFVTKEVVVDDKLVTLQIWDTAGQERFQSLGVAFYRGADACIIVYDLTNIRTRTSVEEWKDEFLIQCHPDRPEDFPFILVGNKSDMEPNPPKYNSQHVFGLHKNFAHYTTSAKTGEGFASAIENLIRMALANATDIETRFPGITLNDENEPAQPRVKTKCYCSM